jgi:hypothetical protein
MERLATGGNEAGLVIGRYKHSWLTDHPLAWDADAVGDLNDGISGDAGWTVFGAWGDTGQVIGFGTARIDATYHQRGYLLTPRPIG